MAKQYEMFKVRVTDVEQATPLIKRFTLAREDGASLPAFSGGSHVIVQMQSACGSQFSNAYSLMSDPRDLSSYQIGVRLEEQSKGGSAFMHNHVQVGTELTISTPNNLFALDPTAGRHVLIAGGIGITPFLAQLHELEGSDTPTSCTTPSAPRSTAPSRVTWKAARMRKAPASTSTAWTASWTWPACARAWPTTRTSMSAVPSR
ncbi:Phthalate dioxygenase reductase [Pseudomonas putida]|nr:Phthalate dioxygenase reductase [Pseudomonas putida]CAB5563585.1 Phthalate dioxygenase reductase [Pseudomonas putida]CAB5569704.1 Phthalate dioxygenase reductase [Pseudomonas putida]CAB5612402.1 Phthalate dioxygenase reductase [Pseudomonas putida]CAB5653495.1 Phthalate dioxygenase reductase [Pseudomonas putida]